MSSALEEPPIFGGSRDYEQDLSSKFGIISNLLTAFIFFGVGILYHSRERSFKSSERNSAQASHLLNSDLTSPETQPVTSSDVKYCVNGFQLPTLFINGFQKCGTSTLTGHLQWVKDVNGPCSDWKGKTCIRKSKEAHFFDKVEGLIQFHDPRYAQKFSQCGQYDLIFDATPSNSQFPDKIKKLFSESEQKQLVFIYMLCDPVHRFESAWNHCAKMNFTWGDICVPERDVNMQAAYEIQTPKSFVRAGLYDRWLKLVRKHFPSNLIIVVQSTYFFQHQDQVVHEILERMGYKYLGDGVEFAEKKANSLEAWKGPNEMAKQILTSESKEMLKQHYRASLTKLHQILQNQEGENLYLIPENAEDFMELMAI